MRYMGECTGFSSTDPRLEGLVGAPSTREPGPMFAVELHGRGATVMRPSPRWALPRKDL